MGYVLNDTSMKTHFPDPFCKDGRMDGHYNFGYKKSLPAGAESADYWYNQYIKVKQCNVREMS